jgi:hypothetical protein
MSAPPLSQAPDQLVANPRLSSPASGLNELSSGVDALYLSGRGDLPASLIEELEVGKAAAQEVDDPVPFELGGEEFRIKPGPMGRYRYCLVHPHAQIGITTSERLPTLRVQARSEHLHAVGPRPALHWYEELGRNVLGDVFWSLARLDLFCDVQGWMPTGNERERFVCRARSRVLREEHDELTGLEFGLRSTKTVMARTYDKTRQVKKSGKDWWYDVWGARFDPTSGPVLRVEFELNRAGLVEFGIDRPQEGLDAAARLWASCTDWLSYRVPTADGTKSRWPIAPEWSAISQAGLCGDAVGLPRVRAGRRKGSLRKLTPAFVGYLARLGSIIGTTDLDSTLGAARWLVTEDELRRRVPFSDRIARLVEEDASR